MRNQKILLIGEVFLDVYLDLKMTDHSEENLGPLNRLGGIFHSARACSAGKIDFSLAFCTADYLIEDLNNGQSI